MLIYPVKLDVTPGRVAPVINLNQYDDDFEIVFSLYSSSGLLTIPSGSTCAISGTKTDGTVYSASGTVSDKTVTVTGDIQMTAVEGDQLFELVLVYSGATLHTVNFIVRIEGSAVDPDAVPSDSQLDGIIAQCQEYAEYAKGAAYGAPYVAGTVAQMTDHDHVYVYTGSETGYVSGNWYYWNGSAWTSGGTYNSVAVATDKTLAVADMAADAKVTGDKLNDLKSAIDTICPTPELTWILNRNVDGAGNISTNNYMAVTDAVPVSAGDVIIRKTPTAVNNKSLIGYLSEFNDTTFIRRSSFNTYGQEFTITDSNTTHIRIAFGRASSSGVQISQSDVDNYFRAELYRQAVTLLDGFVNRGAISDLGYTSLAQCARQGYYTFSSSDTLTDLPIGWNGGGLVYVFVTSGAIWQKVVSLTQAFFRYGTTGTWYSDRDYIYAAYENGSGENNSTERLNIHIPRKTTNEKTVFQMGHCIDAESNADVWRIMFMYRENYNNTLRKLTMTGEWECAIHLDGRDDFSGGIVHGDEVDTDITVFADGTLTDITAINTYCHELKIVKKSNLYDPADHSTIIAEHGIEYIYTVDGLKIKQSIKWKVDATLTNCYLAMLPIIKTYSTHRYDDTSFEIVENDQTGYSITIPDAASVTEFDTTYDTFVEMSKQSYPTGLTGGDCAMITDNGGLGYNKIYFPVCSSASVSGGDVWKTVTDIKNR